MGTKKNQIVFCTFFDSNYMAQGLSMINSLFNVISESLIYVTPTDKKALIAINNLNESRLKIIKLTEIENQFPELENIKKERSKAEFSYSLKAFICHYIFNTYKNFELLTYLDSDLFFFSSPQPIFNELNNKSIGLTSHNFHWLCNHQKKYGDFNAGWITFKNNSVSLKCIEDWRRDCTNWCYAFLEGDKYADQKYLNKWQYNYSGVEVIKNKGANVAPWNIKKFKITYLNGQIYVDNQKLIFYHFSNLKQIKNNVFNTNLSRVFMRASGIVKHKIYIPYIETLILNKYNIIFVNHKSGFSMKRLILDLEKRIRRFFYNEIIDLNK